jgi:hypothetical protein
MSESDLQRAVIDAARLGGWLVHHCRPSLTASGRWATAIQGHKGFPDLVIAGKGRVLFLELKSARGRVSVDQAEWLRVLKASGVDARIVRPDDLDDLIAELLARPRRKP